MTLEELFQRALAHDSYSKGNCDLSTTQILKPPQTTWLATQHEEPGSSLYKPFMAMIGTGIHEVLEKAALEHEVAEERFYHDWKFSGKINPSTGTDRWTLGGMMDFATKGRTDDYKVTTTDSFEITGGGLKDEHFWQQNINGWLLNHSGLFPGDYIKEGAILYIFRDWSYSKAKYGRHPAKPYSYHKFDLLPADEIEARILELMNAHIDALLGRPRPCTMEERWEKPSKWAVMKRGGTRALKVCDTQREAELVLAEKNAKGKRVYEIEFRPGACTRCESWCFGRTCPQYREISKDIPDPKSPF